MLDESKLIDVQIKDNKVHVEHKDPVQQIKKEVLPTSLDVQQCAKHARKDAHTLGADLKREISMEIRNKLSESFDFIEESCGSGSPEFEFYAEPKMVSEGVEEELQVIRLLVELLVCLHLLVLCQEIIEFMTMTTMTIY